MVKSKTSPNIILAAIDSRATGETYPVVATVPWKEGVENDNLYIFQDTTKLNPTFLIGSNEQLDINPRSKSFTLEAVKIGVSTGEKTYADLNVTQEKATYEYTLEIKSKSGEITIPASGGSLELKGILTTWRNGRKVSTLETPFTMSGYAPGFSISGKTVTASNRGTVIGPSRAINIVGYTNNTIDGSTISGSVIITQEENKVTKVAPSVTLSYNPSEIPAKGGTSSPVVGNISYITTFSSGETLNDLPTSEYINTITKTNTFKIHTSNSPFSIDESTGVVTIGTRGTILGEALEETIYLTHRVQISYKDNIFEPTSNSITRTADITQQANTVTYSDINISLFGAADIPASGGQVSSGTVSYSQVASYTSGEFENITTGATITYGDPVSANSKDITISNSTVAGTLEVTVSLNGKTATKTVDVYQEQNKVTQIELLDSWAHNYSIEGTAAQNSVGPDLVSRTYNVKYTFLSGATSADKPGTEFGTLSDTVNYSWPGPSGSFTGLSAQSGNVTMASLGTTIVNETTSPQVTRTDKVTWTPSSNYSYKTLESNEIQKQAQVTREGNYVVDIQLPENVLSLSYNPSEIPAKGGTSSPVVGNISYITTFSSGETLNDLPTSEYINTITKTNTFKIHTSNSPFSIDESTGVVTIGTRGTILGEALEETIYLTHRVQISYKDNIFEPTSNSITRTADITQQANTVTYSDINISLFGAADIPASGGQVSSGTVSYSQVASYTSGEFENITTGATITYGDPVSANSKDITISNSTVAGTLEVTVSLNGKTATKTVDVYQEQNKVTQIELLDSWAHNYSIEGTAAQNSVGPDLVSRTYNVKYTFLSGATSADKPGTEFGTLSDTVNYSWPGPSGSFTGLSAQSGNVTMASLGTTIVNETTSPQVTRTDKVTWTPSSNYSYKTLESNEIQKQAQVTREGNYVVDIQLPENVLSLSYNPSEIPAKGGSSSPTVTHSKEPSMIYTSGVQGEPGVIPANTYGSFYTGSNYELGTINSQYSTWKINAITGVLTVTSNKTARVDRGSAESKYHKNFRWVPSSVYNGGGADITRHATATVYQQANIIESEEIIIDSFVYNTDIPVLGGNSSPSLSIHINQLYTSEEVKWVNPDSYTSKYAFVGTAPSTFSINANTGVVSATEAEVSQELKANVKVDVSSPSWNGSSTLTKSAQAEVAQPAGTVIYDTPVITISYPQVPAKGGTVSPTIQVTQAWGWNDDYDEGVNTFNLNTLPVGSYEFTGIATANGSVTVASKGTVVSGVTNIGTARFSVTLNGKFSTNSYVVTQQANSIDSVAVTFGWHNNTNSVAASGGSLVVDVAVKNTYTSTSTNIVYPSATDAGISLTVSGVSGATVSKATITVPNRGSTVGPALTGTVTGNYNGTNSGNSLTFTQAENRVTKLEAGVSDPNTSTVHFWYTGQPIPASGGTATVVGNGKGVLTFSSGSVVTETTWSGQGKYGGTLSAGRTFNMINGNGFTINTINGSVTAANRGTTVGAIRTSNVITSELTLTFTHPASMSSTKVKGSIRGTQTVSQQANQITAYGNPTGGSLTVKDIPASGGTISSGTIGGTVSQTRTYTSGSNDTYSQATPTNGTYSAGISGSNLGTTVTSRTAKGTLTYSYTLNGKSGSIFATVYQQANTWVDNRMTLSVSSTSIGASGGTVTLHTVVYRMYTSGTEGLGGNDLVTSWSGSATGFTLSGFSLTAANRGTTVGNARSITITATYAHLTSNSVTVTQAANSLTWNNPVITFSYPGDIPASGGTITPTVSITQSGSYSSGSPASNTTIVSKSFSGTGVNASTGAYTASSLGTTVKPRTNLVTATVTVTAQGKTASAKAGIWQAENAKTGYKNITINQFFYSDIPYSGGTVSPNSDVEYDTTYTSGATLNNHGLPPGHTATYIWTGSKPSWGTLSSTTGNVTATSNSGSSSRSTSVSMEILYNGSAIGVSASTTVTQKSQGKVSVTLSISLNIYEGGSINASRAVNDSLNVGWTQHDDLGNGADNFVNLSVGQSSASIMSMNSSWSNYSIFQVNMQDSPPWVSGNWSYYW